MNVTMDVIVSDGVRKLHGTVRNVSQSEPPAAGVLAQHRLWEESSFPSLETATNAQSECGVRGLS